ncbi:MAG: CARDB domain-containing protein, partial [Fimbriimonadaceae bacterium]
MLPTVLALAVTGSASARAAAAEPHRLGPMAVGQEAAPASPNRPPDVSVSRGVRFRADETRYWSVDDTTLDRARPDTALGGERFLGGGPGRVALIRFSDLDRLIGDGRRIVAAEVQVTVSSGTETPRLRSVAAVRRGPWGEGPIDTTGPWSVVLPGTAVNTPRGAATWRFRRAGWEGGAWQQPGAEATADTETIPGASAIPTDGGGVVRLVGLGPTFEEMRLRPWRNHGLAIRWDTDTELYSSESSVGRPRLLLWTEPAPRADGPDLAVDSIVPRPTETGQTEYRATLRNRGNAPVAGFRTTWVVDERAGPTVETSTPLAPGETTVVTTTLPPSNAADQRSSPLSLVAEAIGPDVDPRNDALEIDRRATPIALEDPSPARVAAAQRLVRLWNEVFLARSRYGFSPEGVVLRLRLDPETTSGGPTIPADVDLDERAARPVLRSILTALGATDLSAPVDAVTLADGTRVFRGFGNRFGALLGGETRADTVLPPQFWYPFEPVANPVLDAIPLDSTDLLSATTVAQLNARAGSGTDPMAMPPVVLLRTVNLVSQPIGSVRLEFFVHREPLPEEPEFAVDVGEPGPVLVPADDLARAWQPDGSGRWLVRVRRGDASEWAWLHQWQLADAFRRNRVGAVVADLPVNLPATAVDAASNIAANRFVSDIRGRSAADLAALVDGRTDTVVDLPEGSGEWIEIDLQRDRFISQVELSALAEDRMWRQFDILVYFTGMTPQGAAVWARERDWIWSFRFRSDREGGVRRVAYHGPPVR